MAGVDNRIVTMQFNNREFESNARTSLNTLAKLKESMNFGSIVGGTIRGLGSIQTALSKIGLKTPFGPLIEGANKGLNGVGVVLDKLGMKNPFGGATQSAAELQRAAQAAGGPQGMGVLEGGVTAVSNKFIALTTIAVTALANITNKAVNAGTQFLKSFTVAPIMDGLNEYQTTLQSIQVIQANTDRPLVEVEKSLQDLNAYSDTTIYNFGEMAKNVGTFTAAGVNLKDSVASIKGIANMAALSGSNSQQAAGAMYQLSQAIAAGKVGAQDWNSVVNAGMAGKKLQTALAQTAVAMGVLDKATVKTNKSTGALMVNGESFKNSIMAKPGQESWLSSDVLVNTLASLDGRFSVAYQKAQLLENGTRKFTDAQIKSNMAEARANLEKKNGVKYTDEQYAQLLKMAEAATKAAQDVKTLGQVFDIAKETIGSGWAASFKSIFGNLAESKKLFTGMSNGLNDIISKNALARNELLAAWKEGGGRNLMIDGLKDAWTAFSSVIGAVSKGFRDIFPKKSAADLISMTQSFADFMQKLILGEKTLANIRDIAGGFFSVLGIGKQILGGIVTGLTTMFKAVGGGSGGFLDFAAGVGRSVEAFHDFLAESGVITTFFTGLGKVLSVPLALFVGVGKVISSIFGGFDAGAASRVGDAVGNVADRFSFLEAVADKVSDWMGAIGDAFAKVGPTIGKALVGVGDMIAGAFTPETFSQTLDVVNTGLLAGLVLLIRNFFSKGVSVDLSGGLFDGIKETLGSATEAFEAMQMRLKADILMRLAAAIAVMTAALVVLSMIDPAALAKALGAMTGGFAVLIGALATLMKVMGPAGLVQLYVVTTAVTKMAASILLLAFAMKVMASINFGDMLRGLVGLAGVMYILSKVMPKLAENSKGMAKAGTSMILMGIALNILAVALKIFASMSWEEIAKGMTALVGVLGALVLAFMVMPDMKAEAIGLVLLGAALNLIAVSMKIFASMSWEEMVKGLVGVAGSLFLISAAVNTMPKTMMLQAAALVLVAGAMVVLASALKVMGGMGWEEIGKGMIVLAGSMIILAVGLNAIGVVGTIGAVGLLAAAGALAVLAPVMLAFGAMKWSSIIKGLTMLAGIMIVLGVAAYAIGPMVIVLVALGAALVLIGAGLALAGAGALAAATAFGIVVAAGAAGMQILVGFMAAIVASIPAALRAFGEGMVQFAVAIGQGAPAIALAFGKVLNNILDQVRNAIPKMGQIMMRLIDVAANAVGQGAPKLFAAGVAMILGFLRAVNRNVGRIVDTASSIIVNFINGIARNLPRIINSGINLIISFINGVADGIRNNKDRMADAGLNLADAIIDGMIAGLKAGGGAVKDAAVSAAKSALKAAKDFLKIGSPSKLMRDEVGKPMAQGMAIGVKAGSDSVVKEVQDLGETTISKMSEIMDGVNNIFSPDLGLNPTITPVLDLSGIAKEATKMGSILATAPVMADVSYRTASDISALTNPSNNDGEGPERTDSGYGDKYVTLEQHLHSPKPIDSVEAYRAGKTLVAAAKEALK